MRWPRFVSLLRVLCVLCVLCALSLNGLRSIGYAQPAGLLDTLLPKYSEYQVELPVYQLIVNSKTFGQSRTFTSLTGVGALYRSYFGAGSAVLGFGRVGVDAGSVLIAHGGIGLEHYWIGGCTFSYRDGRHFWLVKPSWSLSSSLRLSYADVDLGAYTLSEGRLLASGKEPDSANQIVLAGFASALHAHLSQPVAVTWGLEGAYPIASASKDLEILVLATTFGLRVLL
jgi:hypothetical protein